MSTHVSAVRSVSGKSWVGFHPAHNWDSRQLLTLRVPEKQDTSKRSAVRCPRGQKSSSSPLSEETVNLNLQEYQVCGVPRVMLFVVIEVCWRKVRCGWLIQLWLRLLLLSVRHPQVNSRFPFCAFFSMGSWVFLPSGSLGLEKIYKT